LITSHNTPWQNLEAENAGWNIDPENVDELTKAIEAAASLNSFEYEHYSKCAAEYIRKRIDLDDIKKRYLAMFESACNNKNKV